MASVTLHIEVLSLCFSPVLALLSLPSWPPPPVASAVNSLEPCPSGPDVSWSSAQRLPHAGVVCAPSPSGPTLLMGTHKPRLCVLLRPLGGRGAELGTTGFTRTQNAGGPRKRKWRLSSQEQIKNRSLMPRGRRVPRSGPGSRQSEEVAREGSCEAPRRDLSWPDEGMGRRLLQSLSGGHSARHPATSARTPSFVPHVPHFVFLSNSRDFSTPGSHMASHLDECKSLGLRQLPASLWPPADPFPAQQD